MQRSCFTFVVTLALLFSGTAVAQQRPKNPEKLAQAYFEQVLKDPDSAKFKFGSMFLLACNGKGMPEFQQVPQGPYWAQKVLVNAKNSFGGYVGYTEYVLIYGDKKVLAEQHADLDPVLKQMVLLAIGCQAPNWPDETP
jgi:hypothetical protein